MTELEIFSRVKVTNQEGFFNWFKETGVDIPLWVGESDEIKNDFN